MSTPEERIAALYEKIGETINASDETMEIVLASIVHQLAASFAFVTKSDLEAANLVAVYASDIMKFVPIYREQLAAADCIGATAGSA